MADNHQLLNVYFNETYSSVQRVYFKAYHQLHTGSGVCWGRGWVDLSKRITKVMTEQETQT